MDRADAGETPPATESGPYDAAWRAFTAGGRVLPAGMAGEDAGAGCYITYQLSLAAQPIVASAVQAIQEQLQFPFVRLVPPEALHVTVQGVDVVERLTTGQMMALITEAREALRGLPPFTLCLRHANSFQVAAILEAHDGGAIRAVRARLRRALPWLLEAGRDPFVRDGQDVFLPHMSIAYYTAGADNGPVVAALAPFRSLEVAAIPVRHIELARVRVEGWDRTVDAIFEL